MSEPINEFHALTQKFVSAYHRLKADLTAGRAAIFTELDELTEQALKTGLVEVHEPPADEPVASEPTVEPVTAAPTSE